MEKNPTIGLDIGGTKIRGAVVDEKGTILSDSIIIKLPVERNQSNFENSLFQCLTKLIEEFQQKFPKSEIRVGIGSAGPVSPVKGILNAPYNIGCGVYPINKRIYDNFPVKKVSLLNDCEAIALGYYKYGGSEEQGEGCEALGLVAPGTGLGAAMILGGKPYWGGKASEYLAVELSQTPYFGQTVKEVQAGIGVKIEDFSTGMAVYPILMEIYGGPNMAAITESLNQARDEDKAWLIEEFARKTKSDKFKESYPDLSGIDIDEKCLLAYKNLGKHLGFAIATLVTNFNPDLVILEGSIIKALDLFEIDMTESFKSAVYPDHRKIPLVKGTLKNAGIKGASYWVRL
jgi:glucokinase